MGLLEGKVALVTGAANGIGRGIALQFAAQGAAVGILDRDEDGARCVAASLSARGRRSLALPADVSRADAVRNSVRRLVTELGPPAILVHAAGIMPTGTLEETSEEDWDRVYAVNAKGAFLTCREVLPLMREAGGGSIVLMASITGVSGLPGLAAYSGTKGALIALARALAIDHAAEGIRVNSVSPGTIDSPMLHAFAAGQSDPEATRAAFDRVQPRGTVGTIEEVANVVAFLVSDGASLINGANIRIDGAMSVKGQQPRI
ncbi:MAG TPA: SDR family NAD(P)-dependent oxidoreductase [Bryobacteraceae bacterium]|jgi:NAD(P)-dependent dehydrogenase (short-subunit alcohol dehydrogenase family)|nr:SDR family NAD(P)-dependent oxidoreductase [Bryobacteraceae bacterium]